MSATIDIYHNNKSYKGVVFVSSITSIYAETEWAGCEMIRIRHSYIGNDIISFLPSPCSGALIKKRIDRFVKDFHKP